MTDLDNRSYVGYSLIVVTVVNVLLNLCVIVVPTTALACRKLKIKYLEHKQRNEIQRRHKLLKEKAKLQKTQLDSKRKGEKDARRKARMEQNFTDLES